jgi:hypothetical protein
MFLAGGPASVDRLARTHSLAELRAFVAVTTFWREASPCGRRVPDSVRTDHGGPILVVLGRMDRCLGRLGARAGVTGSTVVSPRVRRLHAALAQAPIQGSAVPVEVAVLARDRVMHAGARASVSIIIEIVS